MKATPVTSRRQYTYWQFTDFKDLTLTSLPVSAKYICGQVEICPKTKRKHLQGFLRLKRTRPFSFVKKLRQAHWTPVTVTPAKARNYCKKSDTSVEGTFVEFGEPPKTGQGKRNDLVAFKDAIKEGATDLELAEEHTSTFLKYPKAANRLRSLFTPNSWKSKKVILLYGDPRTGKTKWCFEKHPTLYKLPASDNIWFDGYGQQKTVLFDDFSGRMSKVPLHLLLQWLDGYNCQVPVKGDFVSFHPDNILITTNVHPALWYDWKNRVKQRDALAMRITSLMVFNDTPVEKDRLVVLSDRQSIVEFFKYSP